MLLKGLKIIEKIMNKSLTNKRSMLWLTLWTYVDINILGLVLFNAHTAEMRKKTIYRTDLNIIQFKPKIREK